MHKVLMINLVNKVRTGARVCLSRSSSAIEECSGCPYSDKNNKEYECRNKEFLKDIIKILDWKVEPERIKLDDEVKEMLDEKSDKEILRLISDIFIDWDGYRTRDGLGGLINECWAYARYGAFKEEKKDDKNNS